jgi:CDP-diacylglycerol--glycerol-3-phosphate 3-phosphatidyltransferase
MIFFLAEIKHGELIATFIFILAASTDGLDGYIARSQNQVTAFGKFMDPLADKLLVSAALISLVEMAKLSSWIAMIIISREFIITGLRLVAAYEGIIIPAGKLGKVKTITQIVAISALMIGDYFKIYFGFNPGNLLLFIAVFFTIYSGLDYLIKSKDLISP